MEHSPNVVIQPCSDFSDSCLALGGGSTDAACIGPSPPSASPREAAGCSNETWWLLPCQLGSRSARHRLSHPRAQRCRCSAACALRLVRATSGAPSRGRKRVSRIGSAATAATHHCGPSVRCTSRSSGSGRRSGMRETGTGRAAAHLASSGSSRRRQSLAVGGAGTSGGSHATGVWTAADVADAEAAAAADSTPNRGVPSASYPSGLNGSAAADSVAAATFGSLKACRLTGRQPASRRFRCLQRSAHWPPQSARWPPRRLLRLLLHPLAALPPQSQQPPRSLATCAALGRPPRSRPRRSTGPATALHSHTRGTGGTLSWRAHAHIHPGTDASTTCGRR